MKYDQLVKRCEPNSGNSLSCNVEESF